MFLNQHEQNNAWGFQYYGIIFCNDRLYEYATSQRPKTLAWQIENTTPDMIEERMTLARPVDLALTQHELDILHSVVFEKVTEAHDVWFDRGSTTTIVCNARKQICLNISTGPDKIASNSPNKQVVELMRDLLQRALVKADMIRISK